MRRRGFFALTGLVGLALAGCGGADGNRGSLTFANRLRIPPVLDPEPGVDGVKRYPLAMRPGKAEFLPGKVADTWGINGEYLGPTLRARRGDRVAMAVTNLLPEPSTLHWHGMRLPAVMDGGPHQMIDAGGVWSPMWTVDQPAATTWYHPHPHGVTAEHVYRGLAGMFIVDDEHSAELPHTYGVDDVPLIVQDKVFDSEGRLTEAFAGTFGLLGDQVLVNGTYDPFFEVTTSKVRLRILNGSNAHVFTIGFADNRKFDVIASDGGLLSAPVSVDRVRLSPGERFEVVVGFAAGEQVVLRGFGGSSSVESGEYDLVKFVAAGSLVASPELPRVLGGRAPVGVGARVRTFRLGGSNINGKNMDMARVDEVVAAGALEVWEVENITYEHNFHIHEVAFRVLSIDGAEPPEHLRGPKDTVFVPSGSKVRLAVEFGSHVDPKSPYMFHCHILKHEDQGMMGQFVIVAPGTEDRTSRTLVLSGPGHSHHGR